MFKAPKSPYLVPFDGSFRLDQAATRPPKDTVDGKKVLQKKLKHCVRRLDELQRIFYAHDKHSILLIFQGMDAAGKDGTIRALLKGINPAGCQVFSFKQPSAEELDHDFMWRTNRSLPERGRIGVFNRSYYEEVLVVKVHPEYLDSQKLVDQNHETIWDGRYQSIRQQEEHLARNGTVILKFWLNVSRDEQRKRFLKRLDEPQKNWKFSSGDIRERGFWDDYMRAFETALYETSHSWAPWYAIPADNKPYMRLCVAEIVRQAMESLELHYPEVDTKERGRFDEMRKILTKEKRK
jgi:PPK2 family polyphosphate:nucleotide phosphotransferase